MSQHLDTLSLQRQEAINVCERGPFECPKLFAKGFKERWQARIGLILAATVASMMIELWIVQKTPIHSFWMSLLHCLIYSTCIGLLLIYSLSRFTDRISRQRFPLNFILLGMTILISTLIGYIASVGIASLIGCHPSEPLLDVPIFSLKVSVLLSLVFGTGFYFYENLKQRLEATELELRTRQLEEERVRMQAIAAQLSSLESRVRPHFLFNTLNSIASLIREDVVRAEKMIERLASLLRFSLDSNQHPTIQLQDEIKIVRDYLEIEKERFGDRLQFQIDIPPDLEQLQVPPFSLQTLTENSIKYCVSKRREGGEISIRASKNGDSVNLKVLDTGSGFTAEKIIPGHGLDNLQTRLQTLYNERGALMIGKENGLAFVSISIQNC